MPDFEHRNRRLPRAVIVRHGHRSIQVDFQPHLFLHREQGFGISAGVIDSVMRVLRPVQMLEIDERIFGQALVERTEIRRAEPERTYPQEATRCIDALILDFTFCTCV
jgi:hypothetical protein